MTGSMSVPDTTAYETFQLVTKTGVQLSAGSHVLRVVFESVSSAGGAGNLDWIRLTADSTQLGARFHSWEVPPPRCLAG